MITKVAVIMSYSISFTYHLKKQTGTVHLVFPRKVFLVPDSCIQWHPRIQALSSPESWAATVHHVTLAAQRPSVSTKPIRCNGRNVPSLSTGDATVASLQVLSLPHLCFLSLPFPLLSYLGLLSLLWLLYLLPLCLPYLWLFSLWCLPYLRLMLLPYLMRIILLKIEVHFESDDHMEIVSTLLKFQWTHWSLWDLNRILDKWYSSLLFLLMAMVSPMKLPPNESEWTLVMISQLWFR